jgi:hypothetical protein
MKMQNIIRAERDGVMPKSTWLRAQVLRRMR